MKLRQTIDFSVPNPSQTENYSLPLYKGCDFNAPFTCWSINFVGGFFKFNLNLPQKQGVTLIFQLCSSVNNGVSNCPIDLVVNGTVIASSFDPHIDNFYEMPWAISPSVLKAGDNEVIVKLVGGNTKVFLRSATVDFEKVPTDLQNWMQNLPDATPLSEINIPGSHDAAAINSSIHTPYACHSSTITEQLEGGIRLLDVRLKVKKDNGHYQFVTCHGDIGSSTGVNEYQTFPSLLNECRNFLRTNAKEAVLMSLKVDDWSSYGNDRAAVLAALKTLLSDHPIFTSKTIPTLGQVRRRIVLMNRIDADPSFGFEMTWPDSTEGAFAPPSSDRDFQLYVQDKYKGLPTFGSQDYKLNLVTQTFGKKQPGMVVLNFASATWFGVTGVYIQKDLLNYFGAKPAEQRPQHFGWVLFDYGFWSYQSDTYGWLDIVRLVVASNHSYAGFERPFKVK